jgi:hypothetical protein
MDRGPPACWWLIRSKLCLLAFTEEVVKPIILKLHESTTTFLVLPSYPSRDGSFEILRSELTTRSTIVADIFVELVLAAINVFVFIMQV